MNQRTTIFALALLPLAAACSGGGNSADTRDLALLGDCSGKYSCLITAATNPSEATFSTELSSSNGICSADTLFDLYNDGSVQFNPTLAQPVGEWTGNRTEFSACFSDTKAGCLDCHLLGDPSTPSTSTTGNHCVGEAEDCHSLGSSCDGQLGCYVQIGIVSSAYDRCVGSVKECEDISRKDFCNEQRGCSWQ